MNGKKGKVFQKLRRKGKKESEENAPVFDGFSASICEALGGKENVSNVECCATRLLIAVYDSTLVNDAKIKRTGALEVAHKGNEIQIVYGEQVSEIKSGFETYLNNEMEQTKIKRNKRRNQKINNNGMPGGGINQEDWEQRERKIRESIVVVSPVTGVADSIENISRKVFSEKMIGDGAMVIPVEPIVMAPADGEISFVFDTKHAVGIHTDSGLDIIVHIGINTVKLKGKGFELYVKAGDKVKKGDNLMKLDLQYLKNHVSSMESPVLCTEVQENQRVRLLNKGNIHAGEELFAVDILE